jgi:hypothetical protein
MMGILWREFPEINRKIAFNFTYTPVEGAHLGCHCGTIAGITANFGTSFAAANGGKNIEVIDTNKEPDIKYKNSSYDGWVAPKEEISKIVEHFKSINLKFEDVVGNAYPDIVEKCSRLPLWVMSDVINYEAPVRSVPRGGVIAYQLLGSTGDFVKYLIRNKIGYILSSPIVQNPAHKTPSNYSLNQGWFWIPPAHLPHAINVAEEYGEDKFPSKEAWTKQVARDLSYTRLAEQNILQQVLNDGVFPERAVKEKRFNRDSQGRFAKITEA